jgi:hypothetical protein
MKLGIKAVVSVILATPYGVLFSFISPDPMDGAIAAVLAILGLATCFALRKAIEGPIPP